MANVDTISFTLLRYTKQYHLLFPTHMMQGHMMQGTATLNHHCSYSRVQSAAGHVSGVLLWHSSCNNNFNSFRRQELSATFRREELSATALAHSQPHENHHAFRSQRTRRNESNEIMAVVVSVHCYHTNWLRLSTLLLASPTLKYQCSPSPFPCFKAKSSHWR